MSVELPTVSDDPNADSGMHFYATKPGPPEAPSDEATLPDLPPLPPLEDAESFVRIPQETSSDEHEGMASIFSDPQDLWRYRVARQHGASQEEALQVGDHGIGAFGDVTASYRVPMVSLPADTPGATPGARVRVTGPEGSITAKVADLLPPKSGQNIALNPAAALAVGHPGGVVPVTWKFDSSGGEDVGPSEDVPKELQGFHPQVVKMAARKLLPGGGIDRTAPSDEELDEIKSLALSLTSMTQQRKLPDGGVLMSDGKTILRPNRVIEYERGGERYEAYLNTMHIRKLGAVKQSSTKGTEDIANEAAARQGLVRDQSKYPATPEGNSAWAQARSEVLTKPKIFRDTTSGLAFDIKDPNNPKPLNLPGNPAGVDLNAVKSGDWNSVPEDVRDVARNIAEYRYPKLSGMALRSPYFQQMFKVISKVDPTFNYQQYDARQKFLNDWSGSGKMGQNRLSFNTALDHINTALTSSEQLAKKTDSDQITNYLKLRSGQVAGSTELGKYEADIDEVSKELARAFTGAAPTVEALRSEHEQMVGGHMTILTAEQRKTALKEKAKLLGSRLNEMAHLYEQTMGKPLDISLVSPEAETTLRRLQLNELADKFGTQGGKRPYVDPRTDNRTTEPFPGAGSAPAPTELEVVKDEQGHTFIVTPDNKLIPYGGQ